MTNPLRFICRVNAHETAPFQGNSRLTLNDQLQQGESSRRSRHFSGQQNHNKTG